MRRLWIVIALGLIVGTGAMATPASASFPGTDGRIGFGSDRYGHTHNIFTMNPDGSEPANLTKSNAMEIDPTWSPDWTRIAFVVVDPGKKVADICVMNADGSQRTGLTHNEAGFFAFGPAWSPNGKRIAYSTIQDPGAGPPPKVALFVMDADVALCLLERLDAVSVPSSCFEEHDASTPVSQDPGDPGLLAAGVAVKP